MSCLEADGAHCAFGMPVLVLLMNRQGCIDLVFINLVFITLGGWIDVTYSLRHSRRWHHDVVGCRSSIMGLSHVDILWDVLWAS